METSKNTPNPDEMPLSPEEIKAIGEIELGPARHEIFLNKHYKKLILAGIAFMVAASAGIGYYSYKTEQKEIAGSLVVQAMGAATGTGAVEPARYDAKAISQIAAEYGDTNSADTARLMEALSLLTDSARVETAIGILENLSATGGNDFVRARALASLASYYMAEEQNEKSASYWKQIIALPANPYSAVAYVNLGDLAKLAGDIEGARNFYTQVSSACPNSPLISEQVAGLRLALLEVDAPKPVAPPAEPAAPEAPAAEQPAKNPFGIDPANPFGDSQPTTPGGIGDSFGGVSTLPGGSN